jgi:hypothetical protein
MSTSSGKIAEVLFENVLETYEEQTQMMDLVEVFKPNSDKMQNAGNVVWRPKQQHAPIIEGWDLTGLETDIIEETYPAVLGTPKNDFVKQRADDLRDMGFWERRGKQAGRQQATELNKSLANMVAKTGSLFYRSNATSGFDFVAEGQAILNERQKITSDMRCFVLNDRSSQAYASDLAARQTLQGRPETAWAKGQLTQNTAEFDIYTGSYLPNLVGGADPATTCTGDQSFIPEGGTVDPTTYVVTNVDYRSAEIVVNDSSSYNIGDKVTIGAMQSVGLADKNSTDTLMTFSIVAIADGTHMTLFPKPIAFSERPTTWLVDGVGGTGVLTYAQAACANVDVPVGDTDVIARLNIDASAKANIFWCKDSIEVTAGDAPIELLSSFDGMKVVSSTLKSGQNLYMAYDGKLDDMSFRYRIFTWYGVTNADPSANGVGIRF